MAALLEPLTIGGIRLQVPDEYDTPGRGSMRAAAWKKGARAAARGDTDQTCPYAPGRGSGSFRRAWIKGHQAYMSAKAWRNKR